MSASKVEIQIQVNQVGGSIKIDGEDISNKVRSLTLDMAAQRASTVLILYTCTEGEVNGEAVVHHVCPLSMEQE